MIYFLRLLLFNVLFYHFFVLFPFNFCLNYYITPFFFLAHTFFFKLLCKRILQNYPTFEGEKEQIVCTEYSSRLKWWICHIRSFWVPVRVRGVFILSVCYASQFCRSVQMVKCNFVKIRHVTERILGRRWDDSWDFVGFEQWSTWSKTFDFFVCNSVSKDEWK